ncbi:hypothetical protein BCON_0068g00250 [Botryotinia convoluta]|uniref:Uncharacterized protein n=1 Tax=Botryotinia convoluta TaxID=54673 RepID=A0A4Z1I942_9HELO|nr:hypothetical protein BCON_0068g00250 [Botryotinia convoluta]
MSTDHLPDKEFQIQAQANECVAKACQNGDPDHPVSHISEPVELQFEDSGVEGRDNENQALRSDISNVVEDLEYIISKTGNSGVSNAHDLDTLWGLIERSKWSVESEEGVKEIHGDEINEEEWSILGESVVLGHENEQELVNISGVKIKGGSLASDDSLEHITIGALSSRSGNRARYKAPATSTQENAMLEHDPVALINARDSRYPKATLKVHNTHEWFLWLQSLSHQSTILKVVSLSKWQSRRTASQLLHWIQCLKPTTIDNFRSPKMAFNANNHATAKELWITQLPLALLERRLARKTETQDLAVAETNMWPISIEGQYAKEIECMKKEAAEL